MRYDGRVSLLGLWLLSAGTASLAVYAHRSLRGRFGERGRARHLCDVAPRRTTAELREGELVRVTGRLASGGPPLSAPLSGRPCAHFRATVELCGKKGRVEVVRRESAGPFYLEDESGRVLLSLDHERAVVDVTMDLAWSTREVDDETRFDLERFLYASGPDAEPLTRGGHDLRYAEGVLEPGELVTAVGVVAVGPAPGSVPPSGVYRAHRDPPRLVAPPGSSMFVSDGVHFT